MFPLFLSHPVFYFHFVVFYQHHRRMCMHIVNIMARENGSRRAKRKKVMHGKYFNCFTSGGSKGAHPAWAPLKGPILLFWHTNFMKCSHVRSWHPVRGWSPLREILDPSLFTDNNITNRASHALQYSTCKVHVLQFEIIHKKRRVTYTKYSFLFVRPSCPSHILDSRCQTWRNTQLMHVPNSWIFWTTDLLLV